MTYFHYHSAREACGTEWIQALQSTPQAANPYVLVAYRMQTRGPMLHSPDKKAKEPRGPDGELILWPYPRAPRFFSGRVGLASVWQARRRHQHPTCFAWIPHKLAMALRSPCGLRPVLLGHGSYTVTLVGATI